MGVSALNSHKPCRILLILTGGTICSFADESGERRSDVEMAEALIVRHFREGGSPVRGEDAVQFDCRRPLDVLSENMTVDCWNTLIRDLKCCDFSQYDGVILLHGTDTLAYTASLLALLMAGTPIPVMLVSAILPIYMPDSNGDQNFRAAVELIAKGIAPDVYAVYRNDDGVTYLHKGAHLLQCAHDSVNFYSADMVAAEELDGESCPRPTDVDMPLYRVGNLTDCVLCITPHVGLNYGCFSLDGVKAVLHGTYHSSTAEVAGLLSLKARCDREEVPVPVFLSHCDARAYAYESTGALLRAGVRPSHGMTDEMTYVKLLVGCAMGRASDDLEQYLQVEVNREFIGK